jgi:hypothetical protein
LKKTALITLVTALSSLILIGCGAKEVKPEQSHHQSVELQKHSQKMLHHAIKQAGEEDGWRMTEFGGHSFIAERNDDVVTIKYGKGAFTLDPENSSLESAIEDALEH